MPKFLTNINMNGNEIQNFRIQSLATDPSNPNLGQIWFNSTEKKYKGYNGTEIVDFGRELSGDDIINLINASSKKIDDDNLSSNVNDAISKRHSHNNKSILDSITAAYTTEEKNKLSGIESGAQVNTVNSVNQRTGDVVLTGEDIQMESGASNTIKEKFDDLNYQWTQEFDYVYSQFNELDYRLDLEFDRVDNELANKSDKNHNHTLASLSERSYNSLTDKPTLGTAASRNVGTSEGNVPVLGAGGKLNTSVLPPLAIGETFVVNSESAMIALSAQRGDVAVRTDLNKTFILSQEPASSLSNWVEMLATGTVVSVNGKTGAVSLTKSDVGLGSVQNYGIATQAEAEAGTSSTKYMTPQRTSQAITALSPVKSVNNRTGEVYLTADEIPVGGSIVGTVLTVLEGLIDQVDGLALEKTNKYAANIGNGSDTEFTITHNFGTKDVVVGIEEVATGEMVSADVIKTSPDAIKVMFAQPPSANQYRVTIIG